MTSTVRPSSSPLRADPFVGGGEMGELMRSVDWSRDAARADRGLAAEPADRGQHPASTSRFPMYIAWGPEFVQFYNDAYRPILGSTKHPAAMGQPTPRLLRGDLGHHRPDVRAGDARRRADLVSRTGCSPLDRHGYVEECYFTFSYSPIRDETGGVGGVYVHGHRDDRPRPRRAPPADAARALAERAPAPRSTEEACDRRDAALLGSEPRDLPFALLYLLDDDGETPALAGSQRIERLGLAPPDASGAIAADGPLAARPSRRRSSRRSSSVDGSRGSALPRRPGPSRVDARARPADRRPGLDQPVRLPRRRRQPAARARRRLPRLPARWSPVTSRPPSPTRAPTRRSAARRGAGRARPRQDHVLQQRQPRVPHAADADARPDRGRARRRRQPLAPAPRASSRWSTATRCAC